VFLVSLSEWNITKADDVNSPQLIREEERHREGWLSLPLTNDPTSSPRKLVPDSGTSFLGEELRSFATGLMVVGEIQFHSLIPDHQNPVTNGSRHARLLLSAM